MTRSIYCCACGIDVPARLTTGREIYPHRPDLVELPFWRCPQCHNTVGCHHKTRDRTRPLGVIANEPMRKARARIHAILDPIWKERHMQRGKLYSKLGRVIGREYHTAQLRTLDEARAIYEAVLDIRKDIGL